MMTAAARKDIIPITIRQKQSQREQEKEAPFPDDDITSTMYFQTDKRQEKGGKKEDKHPSQQDVKVENERLDCVRLELTNHIQCE